jgi:triosephosphate isomerase
MNNLIIANLKMNKTYSESVEYLEELENKLGKGNKKVYICLPYTSLTLAKQFDQKGLQFGAQNIHEEEAGPFTGEISARMLADLNIKLVIIGHSERRRYFNETNERINKKIKTALRYGFQIILCVGETRAQRNTGKTRITLEKQIVEALVGIYENELRNITIAYEPVWAVGTGMVADNYDITMACKHIRHIISDHYSKNAGEEIKIIYGGSLTSQTANRVFRNNQIEGALVGGACLNANEFIKIINS